MVDTKHLEASVRGALALLPISMASKQAVQMLYAIGWQESRFEHRVQIGGPAHGFWQFERGGGVKGVLAHPLSKPHIRGVLQALAYEADADTAACYTAITHNDVLAAAFARLLLFTHPSPLPALSDPQEGWKQYKETWRPGKPHPKTWMEAWDRATFVSKNW